MSFYFVIFHIKFPSMTVLFYSNGVKSVLYPSFVISTNCVSDNTSILLKSLLHEYSVSDVTAFQTFCKLQCKVAFIFDVIVFFPIG